MTDEQPSHSLLPTPRKAIEQGAMPLLNALRNGVWGLVVMLVLSISIAGGLLGMPGVWGALMGTLLAGMFALITVVIVLLTRNLPSNVAMGIVLGSWVLKLVLAMIFVAVIRSMSFYNRPTLFAVMVIALVIVLVSETIGAHHTQVAYVEPVATDTDQS